MLARRILLVRPALYLPAQVRTIRLARVALGPARKTPPPPPPRASKMPASKKATTAKKARATLASKTTTKKAATAKKTSTSRASKATTKKAAISKKAGITRLSKTTAKRAVAAAPIRRQLTDKEKAARARAREREKLAKAKQREREKVARAKRLEREKVTRAKQREREMEAKAKAREREKSAKERAKERAAKARERQREMKMRAQERVKARKEKEKLKAEKAKALKKPYPPPPKHAGSGYILFAHDPKVNRDRGVGPDDAAKAGAAWRALSDAERQTFNKKAEKARAQWKEDVAKWVASLNFAQLTAARANREPGTRGESALKTLPSRPSNAYGMFITEQNKRPDFRNKVEALAKKESGGDDAKLKRIRIGVFGRTLGDTWKSMSEKEKAVYAAKSADAKKQWEKTYGSLLAAQREALVSAHS